MIEVRLTGHHLEYLHHLYIGASCRKSDDYIFAVPEREWKEVKDKKDWPKASNIKWIMLNDDKCHEVQIGNQLTMSFKLSRFIKLIAIKEHVDKIILISLAPVVPFLPLFLPSKIKISGIIYKIYLRAARSRLSRVIDWIRYTVMAKNKGIEKILVLNDRKSAEDLNKIYKSNKFTSLVDPVPTNVNINLEDLRYKFDIPQESIVFIHFGAMTERKGTLEILRSLQLFSHDELSQRCFIFAGKVAQDIRHEFYLLVDIVRSKGGQIIVKDEFCSYGFLYSLCHTGDCILIPYKLTDLSSGVLGYAAVFQTPVIGPSSGLIGELIKEYGFGDALDDINPIRLKEAILGFQPYALNTVYAERNTVDTFIDCILT